MNNLRHMEKIARGRRQMALTNGVLDNLLMWLESLKSANAGIHIKRVIFWKPTLITFYATSEIGMGGHYPMVGLSWCYHFSE